MPRIHIPRTWTIYRRQTGDYHTSLHLEFMPLLGLAMLITLMIISPARVWTILLVGLVFTLVISLGWAWLLITFVRFDRELLYKWVQIGDRLEETFSLHNTASTPTLLAEIEDQSSLPGYQASVIRSLPSRGSHTWRIASISQRRGLFQLGPTTIRLRIPLGMVGVTHRHGTTREVLVYPPVLTTLDFSEPPGGGHGNLAGPQRTLEEIAANTVRSYIPGDPIRHIHWPLSIRKQTILVKEFSQDTGSDMWILLDLDAEVQAGLGTDSTAEQGIIWAASYAWHLLRRGNGAGLITYGPQRTVIAPRKGSAHMWELLRALAMAEATGTVPLAAQIHEMRPYLNRGHAVSIVTPSSTLDWVKILLQAGIRSAVKQIILLDPVSFGTEHDPTTFSELRATLSTYRIATRVVQRMSSLIAQPVASGSGDWKFETTGYGHAIVRSRPERVSQ